MKTLITLVVAALLIAGGLAAWNRIESSPALITERCIARDGSQAVALNPRQSANAALIAAIGNRRNLPARAITIALATAMQESGLRNLDHGDRDSLGMFQQRPSQGWGSPDEVMDPYYATNAFYDVLIKVEGYQKMEVTDAAQAVQRSAFPTAYAQHEKLARLFASGLTGFSPASISCQLRPVDEAEAAVAITQARKSLKLDYPSLEITRAGSRFVIDASGLGGPEKRSGWALASWAVMTAQRTGLSRVTVNGMVWQRSDGEEANWRKLAEDDPAAADAAGVVSIS